MSLRRLILKFAPPNQFCQYATLTSSKWKQTPFTRQNLRAVHISSFYNAKQKLRKSPKISASDVINQVIPPYELPDRKRISVEDWRLNRDSFKDPVMFREILEELLRRNMYDAAKAYIEMIKKFEPQLLTPFNEVYILRFFVHSIGKFSVCGNEEDLSYILSTYRKITKAFPVLDYFSAETLFLAMQQTPEWKVALELLDNLSLLQKPKAIVFSSIIYNALKENDVQLAWSLIDTMRTLYLCPHDECWIQWLQLCRQSSLSEWNDGVGRMLEEFHSNHIQMSCAVATELVKYIEELYPNYSVEECVIQPDRCSVCSTKLETKFSSAEHADLKEMVEKIINHDSVYASTTPAEMEKFKTFIENCPPYDVVIDGLNAMYNRRVTFGTISDLKRRHNFRFLFLGRVHIAQNKDFRNIASICRVFLCDNISRDDVYILYAAVYHRPDVKFMSGDRMRPEVHYLADDNRRNLFLRWHHMSRAEFGRHMNFPTFLPEIHKSDDGVYHIPCVDEVSTNLTWKPAEPSYWLCIRPGRKNNAAKRSTSKVLTRSEPSLYKPDSTPQVNADGTTIVDDLIKRLKESDQFPAPGCLDSGIQDELTRKKPIKGIIKGLQKKYRQEIRANRGRDTSSWLSDSLCQGGVNDEDVVTKVKRRFSQMHDTKGTKKDDTQKNLPGAGNEK